MSKRTKAGRKLSFREYVNDPYGMDATDRWWSRLSDDEVTNLLMEGRFLKDGARVVRGMPL